MMADSPYLPLEGDPADLAWRARRYQEIGEAITRTVATLHAIGDDHAMTSRAVDALRTSAKDVGDDIDKAKDRYTHTAVALQTYAAALRSAQDAARAAIARIEAAQRNAEDTQAAARRTAHAAAAADAADQADAQRRADDAAWAAGQAELALQAAQREWHDALVEKQTAARTAIAAIVDVVDKHNNGLADPWWQKVLSEVYQLVKTVCEWAAVLSIFLAFVPGLGELLMALTAIGSVITLIEATVKLVQGDSSWGDFAMAAAGVALTLFGGKLIDMAVKGVRGAAVLRAGDAFRKAAVDAGETSSHVIGGAVVRGQRSIQGWGRMAYMSQREAAAAKSALTDAVRSPSGFARAARRAFHDSHMESAYVTRVMEHGWRAGMKENVAQFALDAKSFGNRDLVQAWKSIGVVGASGNGSLVAAAITVTALKAGQDTVGVYNAAASDGVAGGLAAVLADATPSPVGDAIRVVKAVAHTAGVSH